MNNENQSVDSEFEEFAKAGEVEVGEPDPSAQPEKKSSKESAEPEEDEGDEGQEGDTGDNQDEDESDDQDEDDPKPKKSSKDYQIERLKREKAEMAAKLREVEKSEVQSLRAELEALKKGLQGNNTGDNSQDEIPAPDPNDLDKYPLGHLDPAYIEDRIEWSAEKKAAERADAALQRQQEIDQANSEIQPLLEKVDDLTNRGLEIYDDFREAVVETGLRGDWDLEQATFEAAAEAENGAQILYELANDPKEASRVAKLSPYQQMKYVAEKDAEIGASKTPRRKPQAGEPPKNTARGANSRTQINPATDNLEDFEKAWEADARKSNR